MTMNAPVFPVRTVMCLLGALLLIGGCSKKPHLASSASIVIEPGVSFGSISNGWNMQQVINSLGEPDERNDRELKYFNLGFFVEMKNNVVHTINCVAAAAPGSSYKKSFAGHTKEGIGIGSTREDIVKAYGEPTTIESSTKTPDIEVLRYKPLGLFFMLRDGKVRNLSVIFESKKR
jgi:hypothetical protein